MEFNANWRFEVFYLLPNILWGGWARSDKLVEMIPGDMQRERENVNQELWVIRASHSN